MLMRISARPIKLAPAFIAVVIALAGPWAAQAAQPRGSPGLMAPVAPACISSPFGPRVLPSQPQAGTYHYGIDLPAPIGTDVRAVARGTLIRVQDKGPGGLEMLVQHPGFVGVYSHLKIINPVFARGKTDIERGESLGLVGITGVTSGPHVYFEMIVAGTPVDPAPYLGVTACNGSLPVQAVQRKPDADTGKLIDGRRYYQITFPARQ
jgi:murein DD-endopeptidase MepM/ murein hydrolase activator NlpD